VTEPAFWHQSQPAIAFLARLSPDDLSVRKDHPIIGEARFMLSGEVVEDLTDMREAWIDRAFGASFRDAEKQGRAAGYLDYDAAQPSVWQVLNERFGDPARFGGYSTADADAMWRAAAKAALADQRRVA